MNDFNLKGKVAVITGGAGVICSAIARSLAFNGVLTAILDRNEDRAKSVASELERETGARSEGFAADVLDKISMEAACGDILGIFGKIDILINGAGGNAPTATTKAEMMKRGDLLADTFFGLDEKGFDQVFDLNFKGTLIATMVFSQEMVKRGSGSIVNISSMNSYRPLTRIPAYSASKAAVNNFTQWLAVHFAETGVRVNAIAPGFLLTNQNRFLLTDEQTGQPTPRGKKILGNTPMGRYGAPEEMSGAVLFLTSELASFITGIVIPVDGGFSAYSGV